MSAQKNLFIVTFIFVLLFNSNLWAQANNDSILYTIDFKFNDGIFLNIEQVKENQAISFKNIISKDNYKSNQFLDHLLSENKFTLFYEGQKTEIQTKNLWGFSRNGILYYQLNQKFHRITSIGSISFFVANIEVEHSRYDDPFSSRYSTMPTQSYKTTELHKFLFDINNGTLFAFSAQNVADLISSDFELHQEFTSLRKRKRNKMAFIYIRRFNEKHPLYFPK